MDSVLNAHLLLTATSLAISSTSARPAGPPPVTGPVVLLSRAGSPKVEQLGGLQECVDRAAAQAAGPGCVALGSEPFVCSLPPGTHRINAPTLLPAFPAACPLLIRGDGVSTTTLTGLWPVDVLNEWAPRCVDPRSSTSHPCDASPVLAARVRVPRRFAQYQQLLAFRSTAEPSEDLVQLHLARWPNVALANASNPYPLLSYSGAWRNVSNGSTTGHIISQELIGSAVNWTGGTIMAVFKTQYTFTRQITAFDVNTGAVLYPVPPGPGEGGAHLWGRYWLSGVLGALDAPGEWHFEADAPIHGDADTVEGTLHYFPPIGQHGSQSFTLLAKGTDYAIQQFQSGATTLVSRGKEQSRHNTRAANVHIEALRFLGVTISLDGCDNCSVTACDFVYPSFEPEIPEMSGEKPQINANYTRLSGDNLQVRSVRVFHTPHSLHLYGRNVSVENLLVEDQGWYGTLQYPAVNMRTVESKVSNVEIRHVGNVGLQHSLWKWDAEHVFMQNASRMMVQKAYIHHGCILAEDCALLYTGNIYTDGTSWSHSFLHDSGQMCMRFDDHAVNGSVSHVIVFNCGQGEVPWTPVPWGSAGGSSGHGVGGLFKGDYHTLSHITAYDTAMNSLSLASVCGATTSCNNHTVVEATVASQLGTAFGRGVAGWKSNGNVIGEPVAAWGLRLLPSDETPAVDWDPRPHPGSMLCRSSRGIDSADVEGVGVGAFACSDDPNLNWRPGCTLDGCTQWSGSAHTAA